MNDPVNATDPTGEFINFAIGAGVGLITEGIAIAAEGGDPFDVQGNAGRYARSAAVGALTGGVAGAVSKGLMGARAVQQSSGLLRGANQVASDTIGGAAGGASGEVLNQTIDGEQGFDVREVAVAGVAGMGSGAIASGAGQLAGIATESGAIAAGAAAASQVLTNEPSREAADDFIEKFEPEENR